MDSSCSISNNSSCNNIDDGNDTTTTTTTAWVLNDDDWNQAWMDETISSSSQRQPQEEESEEEEEQSTTVTPTLSRSDSEISYQRKFGTKRRPSLNGRRHRSKHPKDYDNNNNNNNRAAIYLNNNTNNRNYEDNDNSTISTVSSMNSTLPFPDDRDTAVSVPTLRGDDDENHRHDYSSVEETDKDDYEYNNDDEKAGEEVDRIIHKLYRCNVSVVNNPPYTSTNVDEEQEMSSSVNVAKSDRTTTPTNITPRTATKLFTPPKIRKNRHRGGSKSTTETSTRNHKTTKKKSVSFHKYDKVIYSSNNKMEYVYSLYSYEMEKEKKDYDVVDDIETVVNDVGYFFHCLQKSISEDVLSKSKFILRRDPQKQQQQQSRR